MVDDRNEAYFSFIRRDIEPLLPRHCGSVLEVGCGKGGTLAWLKESGRASRTVGIEISPGPASDARQRADEIIEDDADRALDSLPEGAFDTILCLDVLEHLADPWGTMRRIHRLLAPSGSLVVSLPNVRHYSVVLPLLVKGTWRYADSGILDRTHLRFFGRDGARDLLHHNGFRISATADAGLKPARLREAWKRLLSLTPWRDLGVFQFLIRAEKCPLVPSTASSTRPGRLAAHA